MALNFNYGLLPLIGGERNEFVTRLTPDEEEERRRRDMVNRQIDAIGPTRSSQSSRSVETAAEKSAFSQYSQERQALKENALSMGDINIDKANMLNEQALGEQQQAQAWADYQHQRQIQAEQRLAKAESYLAQERERFAQNSEIRDVFEGKPAAAMAALLMTNLGAYRASQYGGDNQPGKLVANIVDQHMKKEANRILQSKEILNLAGKERDVAEAAAGVELKNYEQAINNLIMAKRTANMRAFGADEATIAADNIIHTMNAKDAEDEMIRQKGLRATVESSTNNSMQQQMRASAMMGPAPVKIGTDDKKAIVGYESLLNQIDKTIANMESNPDAAYAAQRAKQTWQKFGAPPDASGKVGEVTKALHSFGKILGLPATLEDAVGKVSNHDYHFEGKDRNAIAAMGRELLRDQNTMAYGLAHDQFGTLTDNEKNVARETFGTVFGSPEEQLKAMRDFRNIIQKKHESFIQNTPGFRNSNSGVPDSLNRQDVRSRNAQAAMEAQEALRRGDIQGYNRARAIQEEIRNSLNGAFE